MKRLPDLTGKTVLVVGGGQCAIEAVVADYIIAASSGIRSAPKADMLVTIDNVMPPHGIGSDRGFTRLRVVGIPSADASHVYIPLPYERVKFSAVNEVHFRNNGISAIRIAAERGAKKILLAGFDPKAYDTLNEPFGFAGVLAAAMPALISELSARGVVVEYVVARAAVPSPPPRKRLLDSKH